MSIDLPSFLMGAVIGSIATYYLWRWFLTVCIGQVLEGKRKWHIGGRQFTIVEVK